MENEQNPNTQSDAQPDTSSESEATKNLNSNLKELVGVLIQKSVDSLLRAPLKRHAPVEDPYQETILEEAERLVGGHRQDDYGTPEESFRRIAELWEAYHGVSFTKDDVAAMMILLKLSRGKGGATGFSRDTIVDIAGYARILELLEGARDAKRDEEFTKAEKNVREALVNLEANLNRTRKIVQKPMQQGGPIKKREDEDAPKKPEPQQEPEDKFPDLSTQYKQKNPFGSGKISFLGALRNITEEIYVHCFERPWASIALGGKADGKTVFLEIKKEPGTLPGTLYRAFVVVSLGEKSIVKKSLRRELTEKEYEAFEAGVAGVLKARGSFESPGRGEDGSETEARR